MPQLPHLADRTDSGGQPVLIGAMAGALEGRHNAKVSTDLHLQNVDKEYRTFATNQRASLPPQYGRRSSRAIGPSDWDMMRAY